MNSLYLSVDELAAVLHQSPQTVRANASRAPHRLPPPTRLPGHRALIWRREIVEQWLSRFDPDPENLVNRRGRPRLADKSGGAK